MLQLFRFSVWILRYLHNELHFSTVCLAVRCPRQYRLAYCLAYYMRPCHTFVISLSTYLLLHCSRSRVQIQRQCITFCTIERIKLISAGCPTFASFCVYWSDSKRLPMDFEQLKYKNCECNCIFPRLPKGYLEVVSAGAYHKLRNVSTALLTFFCFD